MKSPDSGNCSSVEALRILRADLPTALNVNAEAKAAQLVQRLQTLSDDDLTALSQSPDTFIATETNRRLSLALRQEAARTTQLTDSMRGLTRWLVALTVLLVGLTLLLVGLTVALIWIELRR